jgi:hypothetical protein
LWPVKIDYANQDRNKREGEEQYGEGMNPFPITTANNTQYQKAKHNCCQIA